MIQMDCHQEDDCVFDPEQEVSNFIFDSQHLFRHNPKTFNCSYSQEISERMIEKNTDHLQKLFQLVERGTLQDYALKVRFELRDFTEQEQQIVKKYRERLENIGLTDQSADEKEKEKTEESTNKKETRKLAPIFSGQQQTSNKETPQKTSFIKKLWAKHPNIDDVTLLSTFETPKDQKEDDDSCKKT